MGAWLLYRVDGDRAEILTVSLWELMDAIHGFAGDDIEQAVFYPEDDRSWSITTLWPTIGRLCCRLVAQRRADGSRSGLRQTGCCAGDAGGTAGDLIGLDVSAIMTVRTANTPARPTSGWRPRRAIDHNSHADHALTDVQLPHRNFLPRARPERCRSHPASRRARPRSRAAQTSSPVASSPRGQPPATQLFETSNPALSRTAAETMRSWLPLTFSPAPKDSTAPPPTARPASSLSLE